MQHPAVPSILILALLSLGCDPPGPQTSATRPATSRGDGVTGDGVTSDRIQLLRDRVPAMPVVIVAKEPDPSSHGLTLQDYVVKGESIVPLFSSKASFTQSTNGADLGRPLIAIKRALLASVVKGNEVFVLDPQLPTELRFTAAEFKQAFPEPLDPTINSE